MSKTIEEAAREFAALKTVTQAGMSVEREGKALLMTQFFHFAKDNLPLSERLTEEEKKQIREEYSDNLTIMYQANISYVQREIFTQRNNLLEEIFGKEMFEKEGE